MSLNINTVRYNPENAIDYCKIVPTPLQYRRLLADRQSLNTVTVSGLSTVIAGGGVVHGVASTGRLVGNAITALPPPNEVPTESLALPQV